MLKSALVVAAVVCGVLAGRSWAVVSPLSWSSPVLVDGYPPEPYLDGVSCPVSGLCVAVDSFGNVVTSTDPTGGSGGWSVSDVDERHTIVAVSCTSASSCVAVDDVGNVLVSTDPTGGASDWSVVE